MLDVSFGFHGELMLQASATALICAALLVSFSLRNLKKANLLVSIKLIFTAASNASLKT